MYFNIHNKTHCVIFLLSLLLLFFSIYFQIDNLYSSFLPYTISYEYINVKDMSKPRMKLIKSEEKQSSNSVIENENWGSLEAVKLDQTNDSKAKLSVPKVVWHLPVEIGQVTQYPSFGHVAYDITSYRQTGEVIHPIANGVVSGIYTDMHGALIVTVLHDVDGVKYTSQYVHLSSYAEGLFVGREVTIHDSLGQMGTTGNSTGVHLHIAVLDCALFDENDSRCNNLDTWYQYAENRMNEGFYGLGVLVNVPNSWYNFNES